MRNIVFELIYEICYINKDFRRWTVEGKYDEQKIQLNQESQALTLTRVEDDKARFMVVTSQTTGNIVYVKHKKEDLLTLVINIIDSSLFIYDLLNLSYQILIGKSDELCKLCMIIFSLLLEDPVVCRSMYDLSQRMKMTTDHREEVVSCMAICLLELCQISLSRLLKSPLILDVYM
jgi:hypothetical protein